MSCNFFFFQAEDGIRDYKVTGVQTCALPILLRRAANRERDARQQHHRRRRAYGQSRFQGLLDGLFLNFSYSSVCRESIGISSPLMNTRRTFVRISSGSPSVRITFAPLPTSSDPSLSATPQISAG